MTTDLIPFEDDALGVGAQILQWYPRQYTEKGTFLGRQEEYRRLVDDIFAGRDSWFDCPPGYGVRTLIARALQQLRHHYRPRVCSVQLSCLYVHDQASFVTELLRGLGQIAAQVLRRSNVTDEGVAPYFGDIPRHIYMDHKNLQTIWFDIEHDHAGIARRIAPELEQMTAAASCRGIVVVHGLQQVQALRDSTVCMELVRDLVQQTPSITWLFCGHNQSTMQRLFSAKDSRARGCVQRFGLQPIDIGVLKQHTADTADARWGCFIGKKATTMMLALPRRNTYWFNALCRLLWARDLPPLLNNVIHGWDDLVQSQRLFLWREIEHLSTNQRAVFTEVGRQPTAQPRAKRFVKKVRVSSASVGQAITILESRDLIERDLEGTWRVKSPAIQWLLQRPQQLIDDIYDGKAVDY